MDSVMDQLVPGVAFTVIERHIAVDSPFLEQDCRGVIPPEVSTERGFKAPAKDHGSGVFFPPAIEIAAPIAARASQILTDLGVAIGHFRPPEHRRSRRREREAPPSPARVRKLR